MLHGRELAAIDLLLRDAWNGRSGALPQAVALRGAFGLAVALRADRFLAGLATLSLLCGRGKRVTMARIWILREVPAIGASPYSCRDKPHREQDRVEESQPAPRFASTILVI
ncbi:hypothetical protein [Nonomuraea basaltis]|uniref:hypothetical protein n=1 Tax=Nonomuraea basaltis TaxID=2495887 RepID=UPI00110C5BE7|nr:hypothetical protein [Nonomuraea basaltis]TMR88955.1 hypothetical protein EJK15_63430 [Nonomuraea basaltis]